jgi:hypothetical protein
MELIHYDIHANDIFMYTDQIYTLMAKPTSLSPIRLIVPN